MRSLTTRSHNLRPNNTDQVAINWVVTENFRMGKPMETNRDNSQISYQYQGYAKYIDIVKLFGWKAQNNFGKPNKKLSIKEPTTSLESVEKRTPWRNAGQRMVGGEVRNLLMNGF